jgi:hypothetical protein
MTALDSAGGAVHEGRVSIELGFATLVCASSPIL